MSDGSDPYLLQEGFAGTYNYTRNKAIRDPRLRAERTEVWLVVGQSQTTNVVLDSAYTPANPLKIDNLNILDGQLYSAADPLLGCTGISLDNDILSNHFGNWLTRFADQRITLGHADRVILETIGVGGTLFSQWAAGGILNRRLQVAPRRIAALGLPLTGVKCWLGESDNVAGTSQAVCTAGLTSMIATLRSQGFNAPWWVFHSSYYGGTTSAAVRAAQAAIVNGVDIFQGPDTDTLTAAYRGPDNIHINSAGADAVNALAIAAVQAHL